MSDTFITIIAGMAILILMFAVPMMATADQNDEISESAIKAMADEFVNNAASKGKITLADYEAFIQELNATGNTFEVDMEVQIMGDNPGVKGSAGTVLNTVGENISYSEYTTTIENTLKTGKQQYILHKGDYFIVSVKNTNITLGKQLQSFFYQVVGKETSTIDTNSSALVAITGTE